MPHMDIFIMKASNQFSRFIVLLSFSIFTLCGIACGEVTLPSMFADHMVIQRNAPVHIWGNAAPGEVVTVRFRNETRSTTADELGRWQVSLPPGGAGGPFDLQIEAANSIRISDVLVGDVWVASGQSNIEFGLRDASNATEELRDAHHPDIRLFKVEKNSSDYALEDVHATTWAACTAESAADFSAVAYFFALEIQQDQKVPIGIIESDWGGTPAEAWTSMRALSADTSLMPVFAAWSQHTDNESTALLDRAREQKEINAARAEGNPEPQFPWHAELRSLKPGGLYNAMIAPLTPFAIRGVIWYQGESNTDSITAPHYADLFQTMIRDWRRGWAEGDFPFLFVQIANFLTSPDSLWPTVRDAQRQALSLRQTAMAVTIDIGDPDKIHPTNKKDVGRRLALAARAIAYAEQIEYSGPLYRQAVREGASLRILFDHAGSGLVSKGGELLGFEVAGSDRKFMPAKARIEGSSVIASSDGVSAPVYVRYAWANSPQCNLYNADGLPASPFESQP